MIIKEFKNRWETEIRDSEIQRNNVWTEKFKVELIESILKGFPIEAITLFKENERSYFEIINGKQRIYAIEAFWKGGISINDNYFHNLTDEEREKFWNYDLTIQYAFGTFDEKVNLFNKINQNIMPLKTFELLRAQFYGNLVLDISDYARIDPTMKKLFKDSNRGEKEMIILNIIRQKQDLIYFLKENQNKNLTEFIKIPRQIFNFINDIFKVRKRMNILIQLAPEYNLYKSELMDNKDKINEDIKILENSIHVEGWNQLSNYERILDRYVVEKDNKRLFSKEIKERLWEKSKICGLCHNEIDSFDNVEVDHIIPWIKGGKTIIENAQLAHKYCNRKKGSK